MQPQDVNASKYMIFTACSVDCPVNVQSKTGVRLWELEDKTDWFGSYDFGITPSPWMPQADWDQIQAAHFPGADKPLKELASKTGPYKDWRSAKRAIVAAGSLMHVFQNGPVWM